MAFLHLTGYFVHPLMLTMLLLTLPVGLLIPETFKVFPILSLIAGVGAPLLYLVAIAPHTPPLLEKLRLLLKDVVPGHAHSPINLSIGEPKHATPALIRQAFIDNLEGLSGYPPTLGSEPEWLPSPPLATPRM